MWDGLDVGGRSVPRFRAYGTAVVLTLLAVALSWLINPFSQGRTVFLALIPAVLLSAWYGGLGPGLLSTALGGMLAYYILIEPRFTWGLAYHQDLFRIGFFVLCGFSISVLSALLLRARQRAEAGRKEDEEHLRSLQHREERFRLLLESVKDHAIFMLDLQGYIVSWNAGAEAITGYRTEEMAGRLWSNLFDDTIGTSGKPQRLMELAQQQGHVEDQGWRKRKDGSEFWVDAIISAVRDEQGALRGFAIVAHDTTQQRKAQTAMEEAKQVAEEAKRAKQFIAIMSHELRTPLTPLMAAAKALEGDQRMPPDLREDAKMIRRSVELEARLVDDLLDMNKAAAGRLGLHYETVDAHRTVQETLRLCQEAIEQKKLVMKQTLQATQSYVWADPARLQQVIWNLLKNAVKFTLEGGTVTLASSNEAGQWVFQVSDTGIGIEQEQLPHIFDAYYQAEAGLARRFGGLGLGLSIAKSITDAHGGTLVAASAGAGQGATFTLRLAVVQTPAETDTAGASVSTSDGHRRVLLVEDSPDTRRILARLLRNCGHTVTIAGTMAEAMKAFAEGEFDVLVSDLGLPDGTWWDLLRQIRSQRPVKAIAVSGYGSEADLRNSREAGFQVHLTKPLDPARLMEAIQHLEA